MRLRLGNSLNELFRIFSNPEKRDQITYGLTEFAKAYEENPSLLRFHFHRPYEIANSLSELLIERKQFAASEPMSFGGKRFITQNEIDSALRRGSGVESGKMRICSFFIGETDSKKRIVFLRNEYGIGGTSHAMSGAGHEDHNGKGITLSRGDISMPYDKITLSWTQVAKRIDYLINTDRYLSERDISYIPEYEKKQIAGEIYSFYHALPMETPRPFPYGFDYHDAIKIITDTLGDKDETEKTLSQMRETILEIPLDDKNYDERKQAIDHLEKYIGGEFALFGKFSVQTKEDPSLSPLWIEYQETKEKYPDSIALMQVGDFFEFWGEDAKTAAEVLDINITERTVEGLDAKQPMCGIPSHTLEDSINTLTDHGYTVALRGKDDKTGEMQTLLIVSGKEKQYDLGFGYLGN